MVDLFRSIIGLVAALAIPLIIVVFLLYAFFKRVKVYDVFIDGAKEGFNVALRIIPYLVGMLVAIGIFRASGALDFLVMLLDPVTRLIGMPAEALPMVLMRPLSGSGSLGLMTDIMKTYGPIRSLESWSQRFMEVQKQHSMSSQFILVLQISRLRVMPFRPDSWPILPGRWGHCSL